MLLSPRRSAEPSFTDEFVHDINASMNQEQYVRSLPDREVSLVSQAIAKDLLIALTNPPRIAEVSARAEEGDKMALLEMPWAHTFDSLDRLTHFSSRRLAFSLNKELGLSYIEALIHSTPVTGLVVAAHVTRRQL